MRCYESVTDSAASETKRCTAGLVSPVRQATHIVVSVSPAGSEVEIRVSDTGPGLAAEDHNKVFDPFFTRKEKGTGLGLAIAKKIAEGHGGKISVASRLGQGTTFTVALPRQRPDAKVAA